MNAETSHLLCHEAMSTSDVPTAAPLLSSRETDRSELPREPLLELRWVVNGFLEWHEGNPCPEGLMDRARAAICTESADAFLAARLRRLFAHFGLPLPSFASDDARLIGIAGSAIGMLLTRWETGEPKGWRLVPEQWTSDMAHAGYMVHQHKDIACQECGDIYRAMLDAAPRHPGTNEQGAAT